MTDRLPKARLTAWDIIVIAAVLLAAVILFVFFTAQDGGTVTVSADGAVTEYPLEGNREVSVTSRGYSYILTVSGGEVSVTEADCPDKICVSSGKISHAGQSIICVPGQLVVTVNETGGASDADWIAS